MTDSEKRQKLLNYAYYYLNIRPRTVHEVRVYLSKKAQKLAFSTDLIDPIIARLTELKLLNDQEFVRWYVEGKFASSTKSLFRLKQELSKLGIVKDDMEDYFSDQSIDELAAARAALRSKWRRLAVLEPKIQFNKAAALLARKGFSYDIIKKTIAEYRGDE
ncbi:RecX family transcriptional regulator [Candidatus Microgenomates bacterium]|nr:RecX family transcriptional regulator [Candidatus Microgenomates bacterium]